MIYFLHAPLPVNLIKIGVTSSFLSLRLPRIQKDVSVPLVLLGSMSGGAKEEKELHIRFAAHRSLYEWFRPDPELLTFIDAIPTKNIPLEEGEEEMQQAIAKAGGVTRLAAALGIKHQAVYAWKRVPASRVLAVERLTGISRHVLRQDIFGKAPEYRPGVMR